MPFPIAKHRVVKKALPPAPPPALPWRLEHVVDPAWVKGGPPTAPVKPLEAPTTLIGNYEAQALKDLFDPDLFVPEPGGKPEAPINYKRTESRHEDLRKPIHDFMQRVVEEAGLVLPEDEDERAEALDKIEAKLGADLKHLVKGLLDNTMSYLGEAEEELLDYGKLARSVWQNWIVDGQVDCDVTPQECLDFAIEQMDTPELQYVFDGLKSQGRVT